MSELLVVTLEQTKLASSMATQLMEDHSARKLDKDAACEELRRCSNGDIAICILDGRKLNKAILFDNTCHEVGVRIIPINLNSTELRIGPIVIPGQSPCIECWVRRTLSHTSNSDKQERFNCGSQEPAVSAPFFLNSVVSGKVGQILTQISDFAGSIWTMNLCTRQISISTLMGVHNCPKCGLKRNMRTRSYEEMQEYLRNIGLWPEDTA